MSDFKWKLSRPGIELEFETGSISECIGLLQEEGTQIQTIFGWTPGAGQGQQTEAPKADAPAAESAKKPGRPRKAPVEAVAPDPLPVPTAPTAAAMPMPSPIAPPPPAAPVAPVAPPPELAKQNEEAAAGGGIPAYLQAAPAAPAAPAATQAAPPSPPPLPVSSSPPIAPIAAAPPPVGVLGPKVVAALDKLREGKPDGGQALSDWLADSGLTIKGKSYDDACRAVLMIADEKLKGVAGALGVA